jgi:hypothetical protein
VNSGDLPDIGSTSNRCRYRITPSSVGQPGRFCLVPQQDISGLIDELARQAQPAPTASTRRKVSGFSRAEIDAGALDAPWPPPQPPPAADDPQPD